MFIAVLVGVAGDVNRRKMARSDEEDQQNGMINFYTFNRIFDCNKKAL